MPPSNFHPAMEVYRHAFGGAAPAGAAGGGAKNALAPACPPVLPGQAPCRRRRRSNAAGPTAPCGGILLPRYHFACRPSAGGHFAAPMPAKGLDALPGNGGKTALRYWGRTARSRRLLAGDVPLPARVRLFSARRLSVRGELGEECVLFKAVWFVASLRCWLYFSPAAPICQLFFVRFVTFLAENLCKLQNIVQFEFFPAQETEARRFGPRHSPANAAAPCPISPRPGKTPAVRCNFTILISFLPQIWYAKLYRV